MQCTLVHTSDISEPQTVILCGAMLCVKDDSIQRSKHSMVSGSLRSPSVQTNPLDQLTVVVAQAKYLEGSKGTDVHNTQDVVTKPQPPQL